MTTAATVHVQTMADAQSATAGALAKRKLMEDGLGPMRKIRKETNPNSKRKFHGEEQPGGLVIVRASQAPTSSQPAPSSQPSKPSSSSQLSSQSQHLSSQPRQPASPKRPPSKKLRSESFTYEYNVRTGSRTTAGTDGGEGVDEHIRQMDTEAQILRERRKNISSSGSSHGGGASNPEFEVSQSPVKPAAKSTKGSGIPQRRAPTVDVETPGRNGTRRTSLGARGKRVSASYDASGIITHPHPAVPSPAFYKHIDVSLPESARVRQLLIWCASRAASSAPTPNTKSLPQIPVGGDDILRSVHEGLTKALAQGRIDTRAYDGQRSRATTPAGARANAQNAANRARERAFRADIERAKNEDDAWVRVGAYYDAHAEGVRRELAARLSNARGETQRGRRRRVSALRIDEADVPETFAGPEGVELAWRVLDDVERLGVVRAGEGKGKERAIDPLDSRMEDLAYRVDALHQRVTTALRRTYDAEEAIDKRFAALSLASRSTAPSLILPSSGSGAPPQDPPSTKPPPLAPRNLLRALSRLDAAQSARDPSKASEAARVALRSVRRAVEVGTGGSGGGMAARMSVVGGGGMAAPTTPRKAIPQRARTPGRTPGRAR